MPVMKNKKGAFTLIELLVTMLILAVIGLAIYGIINNGIKIWQKVNNQRIIAEDIDIFFERFTHDIRNCTEFSGIKFTGTPQRLEFATIVGSPALQRSTIGEIRYVYDEQTHQLDRIQRDYSQIYSAEEGLASLPLSDLKSVKFFYYIQDIKSKKRLWEEECPIGKVPLAVRIELQLTHGDELSEFSRSVSIPIGGG